MGWNDRKSLKVDIQWSTRTYWLLWYTSGERHQQPWCYRLQEQWMWRGIWGWRNLRRGSYLRRIKRINSKLVRIAKQWNRLRHRCNSIASRCSNWTACCSLWNISDWRGRAPRQSDLVPSCYHGTLNCLDTCYYMQHFYLGQSEKQRCSSLEIKVARSW